MNSKNMYLIIITLILIPISTAVYHTHKRLPENASYTSPIYTTASVEFVHDLTFRDPDNTLQHHHHILDTVYTMIDEAEHFLVLDLFLFNDDYNHDTHQFPPISTLLADRLIEKKHHFPQVSIVVVTDPINSFYHTYTPPHFKHMMDAGIILVETDLDVLRDSNPLYSSIYRSYLQWFTPSIAQYLPNVFRPQGPKVNVASYIELLNFKANHRKTVMNEKRGLITSWNPHDGSSYHSNIAFTFQGHLLQDLYNSEQAVAYWSGLDNSYWPDKNDIHSTEDDGRYHIQLLTESAIKTNILKMIDTAVSGDYLKGGLFYLSDRDIITALKEASNRGVSIQLILDINSNAFGTKKIGIPNKPVAAELIQEDHIDIRWYETNGEQYHSKFMLHETSDNVTIIAGSANFTRRNLDNYNLETNIKIIGPRQASTISEVLEYYNRLWNNQNGTFTSEYNQHAEAIWWKSLIYRIQEYTGLSSF